MTSAPDFDYLCDLLAFAGSLSRQEAFLELREAVCQLEESPLRSWFLDELGELLALPSPRTVARAREEARA